MKQLFTKTTFLYFAGLGLMNIIVLTDKDFLNLGMLFTFAYIMLVPGILLLTFLTEKKLPWALGLALGGSLSALLLMFLGLVSNILLPMAGISKPLETLPLLAVLDIYVLLMLLFIRLNKKEFIFSRPELYLGDKLAIAFTIILPILGASGAVILSNGGTNTVAMSIIILIAALVMIVIAGKNKLKTSSFAFLLYGITVAILLMTSMRGYFLTGHDVQLEYHVFSMTNRLKLWDMARFQDAYNACLSITILPTYLDSLLHVQDFYIYKFFFQFISGFLAIVIFYLARYFSTDRIAFLSGLVYVTFPTFVVDMAMLNRQGMALLFFGAFLFVLLTNGYFTSKKRSVLLVLFGVGMILSHYSTSYIAIAILVGGYILNVLMRFFFSRKSLQKIRFLGIMEKNIQRNERPRLLQLPVTIILVIILAIWIGPMTETSQNFVDTVENITLSLQNPFRFNANAGPKKYSLTNAIEMTKDELFDLYVQEEVDQSRQEVDEDEFYSKEITDRYVKSPIEEPMLALSSTGKEVQSFLDAPLKGLYNETKQFYAKVMQIFIFLSLLGLILGYRFLNHLKKDVPMEYIALSAAGIFVMVMQLVLPQSVIDYGLLRLFQQNLVLLSLPITLGFLAAFGMIEPQRKMRLVLFGGFLMTFFLILSGFIPQITGGGRPMLALNNDGFYYDAYYIHGGEMNALLWIKEQSIDMPVQSDRYFSNVRLLTYSDIGAHTKLLPEVTLKDAMVYMSHVNAADKNVIEFIDGDVLYYKMPIAFFDDNKNLIYDSGDSKIYK